MHQTNEILRAREEHRFRDELLMGHRRWHAIEKQKLRLGSRILQVDDKIDRIE